MRAAEVVRLTDLSMTIRAAVPRPVWAWMRPSKSISTSSHTLLGMSGVEEPPGITHSRLSQPPRTPPKRQMFVSIKQETSLCEAAITLSCFNLKWINNQEFKAIFLLSCPFTLAEILVDNCKHLMQYPLNLRLWYVNNYSLS